MNPPFSYRAFRVWQRNRDVFLHLWKTEMSLAFGEPFLILLAMGYGLGSYVALSQGQSYLQFIAPGIVASYAMYTATSECTYGSYVRMELQKTFDAIIATPVNIEDVIAGEIFWAATRSALTGAIILIVATLFGLVHSPWALLILPLMALAGLMFGAVSMVFTSVVPSINSFNYYFSLFVTPMFFFGGVFFPLNRLPEVVQRLAWFVPLTPVVNLSRAMVEGDLHQGLLLDLLYVIVVAALFFAASLYSMKKRLII